MCIIKIKFNKIVDKFIKAEPEIKAIGNDNII